MIVIIICIMKPSLGWHSFAVLTFLCVKRLGFFVVVCGFFVVVCGFFVFVCVCGGGGHVCKIIHHCSVIVEV